MRVHALIWLALTLSAVLLAQPALRGTVSDEAGASISRAVIVVHWDSSGSRVGFSATLESRRMQPLEPTWMEVSR
jgi:hypothetical protein